MYMGLHRHMRTPACVKKKRGLIRLVLQLLCTKIEKCIKFCHN